MTAHWSWYEVHFELGVKDDDEIPRDPGEFFQWLVFNNEKYITGMDLRLERADCDHKYERWSRPDNLPLVMFIVLIVAVVAICALSVFGNWS